MLEYLKAICHKANSHIPRVTKKLMRLRISIDFDCLCQKVLVVTTIKDIFYFPRDSFVFQSIRKSMGHSCIQIHRLDAWQKRSIVIELTWSTRVIIATFSTVWA